MSPLHAEDLALVKCRLAGDERAKAELERRLGCISCFLRARNRRRLTPLRSYDLDDVRQEAWLAVRKALPRYKGKSKLETWVYKICMRGFTRFLHDRDDKLEPLTTLDLPGGDNDSASRAPETLLESYLRLLPETQAAVLRLRFAWGLSFRDIARELDKAIPTVKTHYRRAVETLRDYLPPDEPT